MSEEAKGDRTPTKYRIEGYVVDQARYLVLDYLDEADDTWRHVPVDWMSRNRPSLFSNPIERFVCVTPIVSPDRSQFHYDVDKLRNFVKEWPHIEDYLAGLEKAYDELTSL